MVEHDVVAKPIARQILDAYFKLTHEADAPNEN